MSVEIAWKQNILVTDFYLLKSLLVVFGFGSQAFICGFSRQNINSVGGNFLKKIIVACLLENSEYLILSTQSLNYPNYTNSFSFLQGQGEQFFDYNHGGYAPKAPEYAPPVKVPSYTARRQVNLYFGLFFLKAVCTLYIVLPMQYLRTIISNKFSN